MKPDDLKLATSGRNFFLHTSIFCGFMLLLTSAASTPPAPLPENNRPEKVNRYITKFKFLASQINAEKGIPFSIIYAVAGLESAWGRSELALRSNNHFGIKGNNWEGPVYCSTTKEWQPNRGFFEAQECFRWYPLIANSYWDFAGYLQSSPNYPYIFELPDWDYYAWAWDLQMGGYATDPDYAIKLIRLIEQYRLYELDEQK